MRFYWLLAALVLTALLAGLHMWAITDFLYWKYRWFDTPMHLLGGAAIATFTIALLGKFRPFQFMLIVAIVFIAWEVFEAVAGIAVLPGVDYVWDTAHDILNDVIGATFIYTIARFTSWRPVP